VPQASLLIIEPAYRPRRDGELVGFSHISAEDLERGINELVLFILAMFVLVIS
jgi:hypothetical protein